MADEATKPEVKAVTTREWISMILGAVAAACGLQFTELDDPKPQPAAVEYATQAELAAVEMDLEAVKVKCLDGIESIRKSLAVNP